MTEKLVKEYDYTIKEVTKKKSTFSYLDSHFESVDVVDKENCVVTYEYGWRLFVGDSDDVFDFKHPKEFERILPPKEYENFKNKIGDKVKVKIMLVE